MTAIQSFRDLRVWQAGMDLAVAAYDVTQKLPRSEAFGISSQLQRAAVSVPANIAEGHSRQHLREYLQFISIARASLAEVETYLELIVRLGFVPQERMQPLLDLAASLSKQLVALRNSLTRRIQEDSVPYDFTAP